LAIAGILIGSISVGTIAFADDDDDDDDDKKKFKTSERKLKCSSIGSWFNPDLTGDVISSSDGKCNAGLGSVTSAAITRVTGVNSDGCLELSTTPGITDFSMGKKGFIEYTTTGTQCLFDETGTAIDLNAVLPNWCQTGGAHTSTILDGEYTISNGLVKNKSVSGGTGTFVSMANHCDDKAPYGNSFTTKLKGTIIFS